MCCSCVSSKNIFTCKSHIRWLRASNQIVTARPMVPEKLNAEWEIPTGNFCLKGFVVQGLLVLFFSFTKTI